MLILLRAAGHGLVNNSKNIHGSEVIRETNTPTIYLHVLKVFVVATLSTCGEVSVDLIVMVYVVPPVRPDTVLVRVVSVKGEPVI